MMIYLRLSPKAGNSAVLSHWQALSGLRLDDKPEKTRQKYIIGINPITNKAGVMPSVSVEPDLF
jgi:hypothetical protein